MSTSSISAQRDLHKRISKAHARWDLLSNLVGKIKDQYFCHTLNVTLSSGAIKECDDVHTKRTEISREDQWRQVGNKKELLFVPTDESGID